MFLVILVAAAAIATTNYLTRYIEVPEGNLQDNIAPVYRESAHIRDAAYSSSYKSDSSQTPEHVGDR